MTDIENRTDMYKRSLLLIALLICSLYGRADELVYQDARGVVRWCDNRREVRLFGANYCLPSACDYRAAGMVGADRKQMIDDDLLHFTRMGWDALRLSYWGDWVGCDREGNLLENDHLDLFDYLVYRASERGIRMLLSPIVTYDASWPDCTGKLDMPGFSAHYAKDRLITDPKVIGAACNYMRQLLEHVNPYTGRRVADEPSILFIELINEPVQMPDRPKETIACIRALSRAVRSTGCRKLLYYNISQDCRIAPVIMRTDVDGGTYAWYPEALNNQHTMPGNHLPFVSDYPQSAFEIGRRSKLVYEFDSPDLVYGYMYPAMVREFRRGGVQFAAMFAYDMLATAPWNLGWQTHHLNLVYTPRKAAGAIIAAEVMRRLPAGENYGPYPENSVFGDFRVDAARDLAVLNSRDALLYTNDIRDIAPVEVAALRRIAGVGSSQVASSDGNGLYFLDKIRDGQWRLEVYPSVVTLSDPFYMPSLTRRCHVIAPDTLSMEISLPDLGADFRIRSLRDNSGIQACDGRFRVVAGCYLLSDGPAKTETLPDRVNGVVMTEYLAPCPSIPAEAVCIHDAPEEIVVGEPIRISCEIAWQQIPEDVALYYTLSPDSRPRRVAMQPCGPRRYEAELPALDAPAVLNYSIGVRSSGFQRLYPSQTSIFPDQWDFHPVDGYRSRVVDRKVPLEVFLSESQVREMLFTRIFRSLPYERRFAYDTDGRLYLEMTCKGFVPSPDYVYPLDISASAWIGERLHPRCAAGLKPHSLIVEAQATTPTTESLLVVFNQSDCRSWSVEVPLTGRMSRIEIPLSELKPDKAPMLPQDWPGVNPYWYPVCDPENSGIDWSKVEHCVVSMRAESYGDPEKEKGIRIKSISLSY